MYIKVLILTLLLIIMFYNLHKFQEKFLINDSKWHGYRLGDIIKGFFFETKQFKYLNNIEKNKSDSIGGLYIKETKHLEYKFKNNNIKILNKIINKKKKNIILPDKKDVVIHLRLGDIIKGNENNIRFNSIHWYGTNLSKLEKIIKNLKILGKVYIVYGSHKKNINVKLNNIYLDNIKKMLSKYNIKPILKNSNPDEDFIFMSNSKIFIMSGGGFSRIISNIVKNNGGTVYIPN